MTVIKELTEFMEGRGQQNYGENVTIAEHVLLTAAAAEGTGASEPLIAACLLHDVGHWLDEPDDDFGIHSHADLGSGWVAKHFGLDVSEPVRLHVDAKRYLCAVDPDYHSRLSYASQYTLTQQNGVMDEEEITVFLSNPHHQDALTLRVLEDMYGKRTGVPVPQFEHFHPLLEKLIKPFNNN